MKLVIGLVRHKWEGTSQKQHDRILSVRGNEHTWTHRPASTVGMEQAPILFVGVVDEAIYCRDIFPRQPRGNTAADGLRLA